MMLALMAIAMACVPAVSHIDRVHHFRVYTYCIGIWVWTKGERSRTDDDREGTVASGRDCALDIRGAVAVLTVDSNDKDALRHHPVEQRH